MKVFMRFEGRKPGVRETLKLPLFYLMLTGSFAAWQSLFNVHLDSLGYSSIQIGALNALFISTSTIVVPFWGILADKYGNNRVFLLLTTVAALMVFIIGKTLAFQWMLVFVFIISIFHQPAGAVMDGMTMGFVRDNPKYSFGNFRLWASAGYAVSSLVVGYLARSGTQIIFNAAAILFLLLSVINLLTLPAQPVTGRSMVNFKSIGVFFRNSRLLVFLFIIFIYGIAISPLLQFINLYYSDIGADPTFIGMVFFIQAGLEVFYFILGVRLLKKISPETIIVISMITSMFRMFLYGIISVPETAIWLSILHGITIAFFLIGVVEYVQKQTPDHLRTTGQALIWAFHFGAGVTLGNLILGYLRDHGGMLQAMLVHAGIAVVVVICTIIFFGKTRLNNQAKQPG